MGNVVLTKNCNKGCSYCFANHNYDENIMSLDVFHKILELSVSRGHIQLLGGEPTLHPQFDKILAAAFEMVPAVTLISNFLFSSEVLTTIVNTIQNKKEISFLVNSTDLDIKDRMKIFSENYNTVYKTLYEFGMEHVISNGITIDESRDFEYYSNYIDFLNNNLINIERFRISLRFPGPDDKNNFYFINNTKIGDLILKIIQKATNLGIKIGLDCIHYRCLYESKEEFKYLFKYLDAYDKYNCHSAGNTGPMDFCADGQVTHCFPCTKLHVNFLQENDINDIAAKFKLLYNDAMRKVTVPEACTKCEYYKDLSCQGPCLGFYDIDENTKM
jgi:organic radical activating enzyme